jgi:hypothetical protein
MNIAKAYTNGFLKTARLPRMLFILYFANLFTALLLALPFFGMLKEGFAQSGIAANLIHDFDFTTFNDFLYEHGNALQAILGSIKWFLLAYFLLSVFLTGGIIGTFNKEKFTTSNFFGSAAYNFFRFLGLNILTIAVQIIFFLLVYVPVVLIIQAKADVVESEITLYTIFGVGFGLHAIFFILLSMIGDYGKFFMVLDNRFNFVTAFWKGTKYVFGHFLKTFFLYLMLMFLPLVIMYVYLYFQRDLKMATGLGILTVFLIQQAFIFLRCFLKAWVLGSQYLLYAHDFALVDPVQGTILKAFKQEDQKIVSKTEKKDIKEKNTNNIQPPNTQTTAYAIDFNSTFSGNNEIIADINADKLSVDPTTSETEHEGKNLTEEEMLRKVTEEEIEIEEGIGNKFIKTVGNEVPSIDLEADNSEDALIEKTITEEDIQKEAFEEVETEKTIIDANTSEEAILEKVNTEIILDENASEKEQQKTEEMEITNSSTVNEPILLNSGEIASTTTTTGDDLNLDTPIDNKDENNIELNKTEETIESEESVDILDNLDNPLNTENQATTEEIKYEVGQTIEFDHDEQIEKSMEEQLNEESESNQLSDNEIEQNMIENLENGENSPTGEMSENNLVNTENVEEHGLVFDENTHIEGSPVENLDNEADDGDIDLEGEMEPESLDQFYNDSDEDMDYNYESIEQNVTDESYQQEEEPKGHKPEKIIRKDDQETEIEL